MITGWKFGGLEDGRKEIEKVCKFFYKRKMGMPSMTANGM
jgi:hypothetical protein